MEDKKLELKEKKPSRYASFVNEYAKSDNIESIKRYSFHCLKSLPFVFLVLGFFLNEFYYKVWFFVFIFLYGFVLITPILMLLTREGLLNRYSGGFILGTTFLAVCLVGTKVFFIPPTAAESKPGIASKLFEKIQGGDGSFKEKLMEFKENREAAE